MSGCAQNGLVKLYMHDADTHQFITVFPAYDLQRI